MKAIKYILQIDEIDDMRDADEEVEGKYVGLGVNTLHNCKDNRVWTQLYVLCALHTHKTQQHHTPSQIYYTPLTKKTNNYISQS